MASSHIDLSIRKDAHNYIKEAATDTEWRTRVNEAREANGGMIPITWGCVPPMPSLVARRPQPVG